MILNADDPDLKPIALLLPQHPYSRLIEGWGLPVEENYFRPEEVPERLTDLHNKALREAKKETGNGALTLYKVQTKFWAILEADKNHYKSEIAFIQRMWYHRLHGKWFYNRCPEDPSKARATWITGDHWMYLNWWKMDTQDQTSRPSYRDADRKAYYFKEYEKTCTETFANIDSDGHAIPEPNGTYKMLDLGRRLCYGGAQTKCRRSGETNKALSDGLAMVSRTVLVEEGLGIMAESGTGARAHFVNKLIPAFNNYPIFFKPMTKNINVDSIYFDTMQEDYDYEGLQTKIGYASTENPKFYDGKKLKWCLLDEQGKAKNVIPRFNVLKPCLAQGNGTSIHGFVYLPSTVEEVGEGAGDFEFLCHQSSFYRRLPNGQTFSGLFRLFIPSFEILEGFIDDYGYSVTGEVKPLQKMLGYKSTAEAYLQGERDALLYENSAASLDALRQIKKKFPMCYADSWIGDSGDIGFDYEKIDKRQAELRRDQALVIGRLEWTRGFGTEVAFVEDATGAWEISGEPLRYYKNAKIEESYWHNGKEYPSYKPQYEGAGVVGADPFRWDSKEVANLRQLRTKSKSRLSDGGIAVLRCYDEEIDRGKSAYDWVTHRFHASYRARHGNVDSYNEEVLKACIYYGYKCYPEVNVETTYEYFIKKGYAGYLLYGYDSVTGQPKPKPGHMVTQNSKGRVFSILQKYIDERCHVEQHATFLKECKEIRKPEEMRVMDRMVAHAMALLGEEALNGTNTDDTNNGYDPYDLGSVFDLNDDWK